MKEAEERGNFENFFKGLVHSDLTELAYKEFGGTKRWMYVWGGELSVALACILFLEFKLEPLGFFGILILFFLIRSATLSSVLSGYEAKERLWKSIPPNLIFYFYRFIYYFMFLWLSLVLIAKLFVKNFSLFDKTLSNDLLAASAQASFTIAVGLLIIVVLREYSGEILGQKKAVFRAIKNKIEVKEIKKELLDDENKFVPNFIELKRKLSREIGEYSKLEDEIGIFKRVTDYIYFFAIFGIIFLVSLEDKFSKTLPFPDALFFLVFALLIFFAFIDLKILLRKILFGKV
ncbi:MAG: hypothetical protein ABH874_05015 [Methanobacteriota archaeon]